MHFVFDTYHSHGVVCIVKGERFAKIVCLGLDLWARLHRDKARHDYAEFNQTNARVLRVFG